MISSSILSGKLVQICKNTKQVVASTCEYNRYLIGSLKYPEKEFSSNQVVQFSAVMIMIKRKDVDSESVSKNAYDSSEFWAKEERTQRKEDDCGI